METIEFNDYYKDILFSIPLFRDLNTNAVFTTNYYSILYK